jgi:hypothetical protein
MRLSDAGTGITRDSLAFYRDHRHELGEAREVTVRFPGYDDPHDPYLMVLRDVAGLEMRLSGCTTGYVGEGPHGTMRVLIEEGCPVVHATVVLSAATARFVRDEDGWAVADYTPANARGSRAALAEAAREAVPDAGVASRPC